MSSISQNRNQSIDSSIEFIQEIIIEDDDWSQDAIAKFNFIIGFLQGSKSSEDDKN